MGTHESVVLVGVDGSAASLYALDWAVQEARELGWRLHIVCAYTMTTMTAATLDGGYAAIDDNAIQQGAKAVLAEACDRVEGCGLEVSSSLETGDPAGVLVDLSHEASLVVLGTRGRGGFAERMLGTVASAVPAHAHCPVVVVPLRPPKRGTEQQIPEVHPPKRIVVGVDGSPAARVALSRAIDEAVMWRAELNAVAGVPITTGTVMMAWMPTAMDRENALADVEEGLNVVVSEVLGEHHVPEEFTIRRFALDGSGAELLTEFSTAVDLIVVGSRGRGGFAGLLLGSTSQAVLNHAVCPVMVVPARVKEEGLPPTEMGGWSR